MKRILLLVFFWLLVVSPVAAFSPDQTDSLLELTDTKKFDSVSALLSAKATTRDQVDAIMKLIHNKRYDSANTLIQNIRELNPEDPEYFALSSYYYFRKSWGIWGMTKNWVWSKKRKNPMFYAPHFKIDGNLVYVMEREQKFKKTLHLSNEAPRYNIDTLFLAMQFLRDGIDLHPDRLDMRFELVRATREASRYGEMSKAILGIIEWRQINEDKWLWLFSEPLNDNPAEFVLENIAPRIARLFAMKTDHTDSLVKVISRAMIKHYPKSPYGYANMGVLFGIKKDYINSLLYYKIAHRIDPNDEIVIANIAEIYKKTNRTDEAIELYERLIKIGSPKMQKRAKLELRKLRE